jgi:S-adenosylmethionine hydrolase
VNPPIAILTDFGTSDPYVGIMKGVISQIAPETPIIDLTHEIPPGDIPHGAFVLWQSRPYFPKSTIFLSVVDPGVGTAREPILLQCGNHIFIGPDNGLFTFILDDSWRAWKIQNPEWILPDPGKTFHGRDIFAPAAGHASKGIRGPEFGASHPDLKLIPLPRLTSLAPGILHGQILHADRFGNLVTSLGQFEPMGAEGYRFDPWVGETPQFRLTLQKASLSLPSGNELPWSQTFAEIPSNRCGFIIGSSGLIEIVANRQSAANLLNLDSGDMITLDYTEI